MINIVKRSSNLIVWCLAYSLFVYMAFHTSLVQQGRCFDEYLQVSLFSVQKYFFDVSIWFLAFLYIMKKPFVSPMFVARCKETYLIHILLYGFKICLFYIMLTFILFWGIPFIAGVDIQINARLLFKMFNLFSFLLSTYLFYIFILLLTGKQMLAVLSGFCINSAILIIYFLFRWTFSELLANQIENLLLSWYSAIAIMFMTIIFFVFRRKDFLL